MARGSRSKAIFEKKTRHNVEALQTLEKKKDEVLLSRIQQKKPLLSRGFQAFFSPLSAEQKGLSRYHGR